MALTWSPLIEHWALLHFHNYGPETWNRVNATADTFSDWKSNAEVLSIGIHFCLRQIWQYLTEIGGLNGSSDTVTKFSFPESKRLCSLTFLEVRKIDLTFEHGAVK